jgi:hypothetical protein
VEFGANTNSDLGVNSITEEDAREDEIALRIGGRDDNIIFHEKEGLLGYDHDDEKIIFYVGNEGSREGDGRAVGPTTER